MRAGVHCDGIMLDTSAHFRRIIGSPALQADIEATATAFPIVASSPFILEEFRASIDNKLLPLERVLRWDPDSQMQRPFSDVWKAAMEALPRDFSGSGPWLGALASALGTKYGTRLVSALAVAAYIGGQRQEICGRVRYLGAIDLLEHGRLLDRASCCMWPRARRRRDRCSGEPGGECRLSDLCFSVDGMFQRALIALSQASVDETVGAKRILDGWDERARLSLLATIGGAPNAVGDGIIYLETPSTWAILTRDRAFDILQKHLRGVREVLRVRQPRRQVAIPCVVCERDGTESRTAELVNISAVDAALRCEASLGRIGTAIEVKCDELGGSRWCRVRRVSERVDGVFVIGVRFTKSPEDEGPFSADGEGALG